MKELEKNYSVMNSEDEKIEIKAIEEKIYNLMNSKNEEIKTEDIKELLSDLGDIIDDLKGYSKIQKICDMNIDFATKLRFFTIASKILHDSFYNIYEITLHNSFDSMILRIKYEIIEFFDLCFNEIVLDCGYYKPEFVEELEKSIKLQKDFANYFKFIHFRFIARNDDSIKQILNLEYFKSIVWEDEVFVSDCLGYFDGYNFDGYNNNTTYFGNLPDEYRYLVCLTNFNYGLKQLYYEYFHEVLPNEAIDEFYDLDENLSYNPFDVSNLYRKKELKEALKNVLRDNSFYSKIKSIQSKANLDFKSVVNFAYKYYGTDFFDKLIEYETFDVNMQEKISYLSKTRKKKNVEQLIDIANISMQDLKKMKKENVEAVKSKINGGPSSKTDIHFTQDSADSEIRRINKDGSNKREGFEGIGGKHTKGLVRVYGDVFDGETLTQECATIAIKKFGSVTWVIEMETAFIYMPEKPTRQQKRENIDWLKKANSAGKVGIFVYDSEQDGCIILNEDMELTDPKTAIEYILELEESIFINDTER